MFGTVLLVIAVLAYGNNCESTACTVTDTTADCGEDFQFPLDVDSNITKLIVRSMHVKSIVYEHLAEYTDLEIIDLSNCGIKEINPEAFEENTKLKELNLSGNRFLVFPENGTFIKSDSLITLNLSATDITTDRLHDDLFEGTPYLVTIDLSSNILENLDVTPFSKLTDLGTLILSKDDSTNKTSLCEAEIQEIIFIKFEKDIISPETYDCNSKKDELEQEHLIETSTTISTNGDDVTIDIESEVTTYNSNEETITEIIIVSDDDTLDSNLIGNIATPLNDTTDVPNENITSTESATLLVTETQEVITTENSYKSEDETTTEAVINTDAKTKLGKIQTEDYNENEIDKTAPTTAAIGKSGTNIVLGIILCVMVVGALGFAWKYYKNKKSGYTNPNINNKDDDEGKELETIITHPSETTDQK